MSNWGTIAGTYYRQADKKVSGGHETFFNLLWFIKKKIKDISVHTSRELATGLGIAAWPASAGYPSSGSHKATREKKRYVKKKWYSDVSAYTPLRIKGLNIDWWNRKCPTVMFSWLSIYIEEILPKQWWLLPDYFRWTTK